jgi:hypothetical protein
MFDKGIFNLNGQKIKTEAKCREEELHDLSFIR